MGFHAHSTDTPLIAQTTNAVYEVDQSMPNMPSAGANADATDTVRPKTRKAGTATPKISYIEGLHQVVEKAPSSIVRWNRAGTHIIIPNIAPLEQYLEKNFCTVFRSCKFTAMKRQLSYYGFQKLRNEDASDDMKQEVGREINIGGSNDDAHVFTHPYFQRGKPELLEKVLTANRQKALNAQSRKVAESKDNAHSTPRSNVSLPGVENVPPISVLFGTCKKLGETPGMLDNPKRGQKHGRCEASLFGNERSPQPNTSSNRAGTDTYEPLQHGGNKRLRENNTRQHGPLRIPIFSMPPQARPMAMSPRSPAPIQRMDSFQAQSGFKSDFDLIEIEMLSAGMSRLGDLPLRADNDECFASCDLSRLLDDGSTGKTETSQKSNSMEWPIIAAQLVGSPKSLSMKFAGFRGRSWCETPPSPVGVVDWTALE